MTSILISQFLLDLQEVHQNLADPQLSSLSSAQEGSPIFHRVIGSLGSTLSSLGGTAPDAEATHDQLASATENQIVEAEGGHEADVVEEVLRGKTPQ